MNCGTRVVWGLVWFGCSRLGPHRRETDVQAKSPRPCRAAGLGLSAPCKTTRAQSVLVWAGPPVTTSTLASHGKPSPAPPASKPCLAVFLPPRRNMVLPTANPGVRLVGRKEAPAPGLGSASRLAPPRLAAVAPHRSGTSLKSRLRFAISSV